LCLTFVKIYHAWKQSHKKLLIVDDSKVSRMLIRAHVLAQRPEWAISEAVCGEKTKTPFFRKTTTTC
jgi:hypothetical protein